MNGSRETWDRFWGTENGAGARPVDPAREFRSFYWRLLERRLLGLHGRLDGLRTIELGSGAGVMSLLLALRGARPVLLDQSASALERARRLFALHGARAQFVEGNLLDLPADLDGAFQLTVSLGTGEHFTGEERARFWRAHWRLLARPGLAFVSVPNAACPPYRMYAGLSRGLGFWEVGTEIPYRRSEVRRLFADAGAAEASFAGSPLANDCGYFLLGGAAKLGACLVLPRNRREAWFAAVDRWLKRWPLIPGPLDAELGYSLVALAERR